MHNIPYMKNIRNNAKIIKLHGNVIIKGIYFLTINFLKQVFWIELSCLKANLHLQQGMLLGSKI